MVHHPLDDNFEDQFSELLPCPECGAEIYEDAEVCPACGYYIVHTHTIWAGRPIWWIILGLLGILAVMLALASGF